MAGMTSMVPALAEEDPALMAVVKALIRRPPST